MIYKAGLYDNSFWSPFCASVGGEAANEQPTYIRWQKETTFPVTFFTDTALSKAENSGALRKVAWLIEPPSHSTTHYAFAAENEHLFDYILSFCKDFVDENPSKRLYYPFGGSWIPLTQWAIKSKKYDVSMLASFKRSAPGHHIRHRIAEMFSTRVDCYGSAFGAFMRSKVPALEAYRYSIVVESVRVPGYFSEKLIDCFSQGTIPIYWGSQVGEFFDERGIIRFETLDELESILKIVGEKHYRSVRSSVVENHHAAMMYRKCEDMIYVTYKDGIFTI